MPTIHGDKHEFPVLSITNYHSKSATAGLVENFGPFSFTTGGLNPLYAFNPYTANTNDVKQVLATLIVHLFKNP